MSLPQRDKPPPFVAVRGPCDLTCAWCNYGGVAPVDTGAEVARVTAALERLRADGAAAVGFGFLHSEPTTHPAFTEVLHRAASIGFARVTLSTSGLRLADAAYVDALRRGGVTGVVLSLAGLDAELGDLLLGRPGATAAKLRALDNCVAAGLEVDVPLMFLRPILGTMPDSAARLRERTAAARRHVTVHGALMDPVPGMPAARTRALWPTYGEVAWTMARVHERVPDFALHARYLPPCVRDLIGGLRVVDDAAPTDGAFIQIESVCAPCAHVASCRGVQVPYAVHGPALLALEPAAPAIADFTALAKVLGASAGDGRWSMRVVADEGWPAAVASAIATELAGGTALDGYRLCGFEVRGAALWVGLENPDADIAMNAILERRAAAARYYAAGERFVISYASGTAALGDAARRVLAKLLAAAEAS